MKTTIEIIDAITQRSKNIEPFKQELEYSTPEEREAIRDFAVQTNSSICESCKMFYRCDCKENHCSVLS